MRNTALVRRARVAAAAALLLAAFVGGPACEILPDAHSAADVGRFFLFALAFGLSAAIGALAGSWAQDRASAIRRALLTSATLAGVGISLATAEVHPSSAFLALIVAVWGAAMAVPTLPVVHALAEATHRPSHDAVDRVTAVACGFVTAVKLPEALGAWLLRERTAALVSCALAILGAIGHVLVQRRRFSRAALVRRWLAGDDPSIQLEPEAAPSDHPALLSGAPRLVVSRTREPWSYRDNVLPIRSRDPIVVPRDPDWPEARGDLRALAGAAAVALCLALAAAGVGYLGTMV